MKKNAIIEWLTCNNNTCPLTRKELKFHNLIRHRSLEQQIYAWYEINEIPYNGRFSYIDDNDNEDKYDDSIMLLACLEHDLICFTNQRNKTMESNKMNQIRYSKKSTCRQRQVVQKKKLFRLFS